MINKTLKSFCYQSSQSSELGCRKNVELGKNYTISKLQDNLVHTIREICARCFYLNELGHHDNELNRFLAESILTTLTSNNFDIDSLMDFGFEAGRINIKAMDLLKKEYNKKFGEPTPQDVEIGAKKGPGILVTGHDLKALDELLKQTKGMNINVYTHSEMLSAHAYPKFKEYEHLVGQLGGPWFDQKHTFANYSVAILGTSSCLNTPENSYKDRIFTTGIAKLPNIPQIENYDFTPIIEKALEIEDLKEESNKMILTTGFGLSTIHSLLEEIKESVENGKIRRFFLIGGCDSLLHNGNYFRDFVEKLPHDTVVLTLACGKYRFNDLDLGYIGKIPRLIDLGQCNDTIVAIDFIMALSDIFDMDLNDIPLSVVFNSIEEKGLADLWSLFYLEKNNMIIGPSLPTWMNNDIKEYLVDNFNLSFIGNPEDDINKILG
jgi:hydroxylamine reductase